jgi:SpoVK/Ycf46/Vps4 family AAA+-type ATPase
MFNILNYIRAGYPLIWLETFEESRTLIQCCSDFEKLYKEGLLTDEAGNPVQFKTFTWDCADGIRDVGLKGGRQTTGKPITKKVSDGQGGEVEMPTNEPLDPLVWLDEMATQNTVMFLKDYHSTFDRDHCPDCAKAIRKIRNLMQKFKASNKTLIILSPLVRIPDEIEKECCKISFALPDREGLRAILKGICKANGVEYPRDDDAIIDAALGLTGVEAENAFSVSIVETNGHVESSVIRREKAATVEKTGLLEVINTTESMDTIGGNENLKDWIKRTMRLVGEEARAFHAHPPKGVLLVGVPGCGKSLASGAIANVSNRPLLRFDVGKVFDKFQGESEAKIRRCLAIAEAVAPCVLWIDELEKSFSGTKGSDSDGHGTTKRVFSTFLTWLQEKKADVFLVATANNVDTLPPELYRAGRIDAKFWLGLPEATQREEIIRIHLEKQERPADLFTSEEMKKLVEASDKFSGAAIETWVQAAINYAYIEGHTEVTLKDFLDTVPEIGVTDMSEKNIVSALEWAKKNKARLASKATPKASEPEVAGDRKVNLKLDAGSKIQVKTGDSNAKV